MKTDVTIKYEQVEYYRSKRHNWLLVATSTVVFMIVAGAIQIYSLADSHQLAFTISSLIFIISGILHYYAIQKETYWKIQEKWAELEMEEKF